MYFLNRRKFSFIEKDMKTSWSEIMNISRCLKFTTLITVRCTVYNFLKHDDHYVSAEASNISPLFSSLSVKENLFRCSIRKNVM